jgi:hypothetical protein
MARVELREILTKGDRRAVLGLRRGPGQDAYLDSMEEIFLAGDGGRLVGFTMISDGLPEPIDADLVGPGDMGWERPGAGVGRPLRCLAVIAGAPRGAPAPRRGAT